MALAVEFLKTPPAISYKVHHVSIVKSANMCKPFKRQGDANIICILLQYCILQVKVKIEPRESRQWMAGIIWWFQHFRPVQSEISWHLLISSDFFGFLRISSDFFGFLRISSDFFGFPYSSLTLPGLNSLASRRACPKSWHHRRSRAWSKRRPQPHATCDRCDMRCK